MTHKDDREEFERDPVVFHKFEKLVADYKEARTNGELIHGDWAEDALEVIRCLKQQIKMVERERDFFRDSGQRLAESAEYWQDVAMNTSSQRNDLWI
jgi:type I site-specific restriction endonuclease